MSSYEDYDDSKWKYEDPKCFTPNNQITGILNNKMNNYDYDFKSK